METKFNRAFYLRQIPVRALREQLTNLMLAEVSKTEMADRMRKALRKSGPRGRQRTVKYLNRDDLVRIVNKCPEVTDEQVKALFEEYRYGANPSFCIYLFDPKGMGRREISEIRLPFKKCIEEFNRKVPKDRPKLRNLVPEDLIEIEGPDVIEGTYHYQRRVDLIDEKENPSVVYETVYGFFWINIQQGYVVIQAHDRVILHELEYAIRRGADLHMAPLFITKELKTSLPFLIPNAICSSKLHDPNPESDRFRWVSVTDDQLAKKRYYENLEEIYPEVSTARYKIEIAGTRSVVPANNLKAGEKPKDDKPSHALSTDLEDREKADLGKTIRTLSIDLENGEMSIAGKLAATQFRGWALKTLAEIIATIQNFKKEPEKYLKARKFISMDELSRFHPIQREHIAKLVALVLDLKKNVGTGSRDIELSPLAFARDMGQWVDVQFRMPCETDRCTSEGYFKCPTCDSHFFHLLEFEGKWHIQCAQEKKNRWYMPLPFIAQCEQLHELPVSQEDIERWIEILPHNDLLKTIAEISKYIPDFEFHPDIEYFMLHGRNLIYYEYRGKAPIDQPGQVVIISRVQAGAIQKGGKVVGVEYREMAPATISPSAHALAGNRTIKAPTPRFPGTLPPQKEKKQKEKIAA